MEIKNCLCLVSNDCMIQTCSNLVYDKVKVCLLNVVEFCASERNRFVLSSYKKILQDEFINNCVWKFINMVVL